MTQYYSRIDATLNGDVYNIPFSYMKESEISVYINDEPITAWEFLNESQIKINEMASEIPAGAIVSIRRTTDITKKVVDYTNQSMLNRENLNKSQDQLINSVQEIYDNNIQFEIDIGNKLTEVNEAAKLIKSTLETVEQSVETSEQQALIATEQATLATEKTNEVKTNHEQAITEITNLKNNTTDEFTNLVDNRVHEIQNLSDEIKNNAEDIINRVGISMFDTILKDHILTYEETKGLALQGTYVYKEAIAGSRYGYPDFYNKCLEEYQEATSTETVNDVEVKVHSNGHKFYNISDKDSINNFFNSMGYAWFYGIDTENERIFLPRNNYYAISGISESTPVVGNGLALGLTNGTSNYTLGSNSSGNVPGQLNNTFGSMVGTAGSAFPVTPANVSVGVTTDSNYSGLIAKTSNIFQFDEKKHLYICVGNTTNYEGISDVVNQGMEILEQVAQKVNVDGTNLNSEGKSLISGFAMPSDKYEDLTLGATETIYTAPANGWVAINKTSTGASQFLEIASITGGVASKVFSVASGQNFQISIPVRKGVRFMVAYSFGGTTHKFRFIYAEGEQ